MGQNVTRSSPAVSPHRNAFVNPSTATTTTIAAAVAGKIFRVLSVAAVSTIANNINFGSNATAISATFPLGANGGVVLPFNEHGWFQTNAGEALNIVTSAASATGVQVQYIEIQAAS
jgi:hypothetical protein